MAAPVVGDACDEAVGHKQRLLARQLAFSCVVSGVIQREVRRANIQSGGTNIASLLFG
jgi:hypothetical protein